MEYDDVMNKQREVIYRQRRNALFGEGLDIELTNMLNDTCESLANVYHNEGDYAVFSLEVSKSLGIQNPVTEDDFLKLSNEKIADKLFETAFNNLAQKMKLIRDMAMPQIKEVYEKFSDRYEYIVIPITDGRRIFQIRVNLKKAYETECREITKSFEKIIMLITIDENWKAHLRDLDDLKQAVQTVTYAQKDPLVIFKIESNEMFDKMLDQNNKTIISTIMRGQIPVRDPEEVARAQAAALAQAQAAAMAQKREQERMKATQAEAQKITDEPKPQPLQQKQPDEPKPQPIVRGEKKIGRNDPCPCGSGKKYKNCHGKGLEE